MTSQHRQAAPRPSRSRTHAAPLSGQSTWEWRTFDTPVMLPVGDDLVVDPRESTVTETWLLSPCSSFSVRIAGDSLEIKRLVSIDRRDLELWQVIHRYQSPLPAAAVAAVCVDLGLPDVDVTAPIAFDELLRLMRAAAPAVVVAAVQVDRTRFHFDKCDGEHVMLTVGDQRWESFALFGHDPGVVHAALQRLGVSQIANVNLPRALKLMLGIADQPYVVRSAPPRQRVVPPNPLYAHR
jgi:hypothetical protein